MNWFGGVYVLVVESHVLIMMLLLLLRPSRRSFGSLRSFPRLSECIVPSHAAWTGTESKTWRPNGSFTLCQSAALVLVLLHPRQADGTGRDETEQCSHRFSHWLIFMDKSCYLLKYYSNCLPFGVVRCLPVYPACPCDNCMWGARIRAVTVVVVVGVGSTLL